MNDTAIRARDLLDQSVGRMHGCRAAVQGAVRQFQPGMLFEARGDLAGAVNAVVIVDHHDHRGPRERPEQLVQQGDEARRAAAAQPRKRSTTLRGSLGA